MQESIHTGQVKLLVTVLHNTCVLVYSGRCKKFVSVVETVNLDLFLVGEHFTSFVSAYFTTSVVFHFFFS